MKEELFEDIKHMIKVINSRGFKQEYGKFCDAVINNFVMRFGGKDYVKKEKITVLIKEVRDTVGHVSVKYTFFNELEAYYQELIISMIVAFMLAE